jgi:hypothetical protein
MERSQMEEIADQLLKNAREGKVEWVNSPHRDAYQVKVPDGSLVIMRLDSQAYRLDLNDDQGNSLESLASYDPRPQNLILREIHDRARRHVLDLDQVFDKTLEFLRQA